MSWTGINRRVWNHPLVDRRKVIAYPGGFDARTVLRAAGWKGNRLGAHWMGWYGDGKKTRPMTAYASNNDATISKQLDLAQAIGVNLFVSTWQGLTSSYLHQSTQKLCVQLATRSMQFGLCIDPWAAKGQANPQQVIINALLDPSTQAMLKSTAYMPEGCVLEFIGKTIADNTFDDPPTNQVPHLVTLDWAAIGAAAGVKIFSRHREYSWPVILGPTGTLTQAQSVLALQKDNQSPTMTMQGLSGYGGFYDGGWVQSNGAIDYGKSGWNDPKTSPASADPARMMESNAGTYFLDQLGVTNMNADILMLCTWNDYQERTTVEGTWSAITGMRIS